MEYLIFELETLEYKKEGEKESFRVRVANSPEGEQTQQEAEWVSTLPGFRGRLRRLKKRLLTSREVVELGKEIAGLLFPPRVRSLLARNRALCGETKGVRIRLMLEPYALADIPWEYVYLPAEGAPPGQEGADGFLVFDRQISLVRYLRMGRPQGSLSPVNAGALRMVALTANPEGTEPLDLAAELHNIKQALLGMDSIHPEFYPDATVNVLLESLSNGAHIFHFSGHGKFKGDHEVTSGAAEGAGYLSLLDDERREVLFSAEKLALNLSGRGVRLAMFSACETAAVDQVNVWAGVAPALVRAGIPAVVAMQFKVLDPNAITFSKHFYRALVAGQSVDEAVTAGRRAVYTHHAGGEKEIDWGAPVLYLRAADGVLFPNGADARATTEPRARPAPAAGSGDVTVDRRQLRTALTQAFSTEELESLCADIQDELAVAGVQLQVNLEITGGSTKAAKVLNLIEYLERRRLLAYLVKAVRSARSGLI